MRDQGRGTFAPIFQGMNFRYVLAPHSIIVRYSDADGTWKEKLQVYAKQVVINSHTSV